MVVRTTAIRTPAAVPLRFQNAGPRHAASVPHLLTSSVIMRYVRFLKVPKTDSKTLSALVTVTSDLGEDFLAADVALTATVRSPEYNGDIFLRKSLKWTAGMRAIPVTFDLRHCDLDWPVVVHVGPKSSQLSDRFERHLDSADMPSLISAWSSPLDAPAGIMEADKMVERRFTPLSNRTLRIWEETGDSIARHIWLTPYLLPSHLSTNIRKGRWCWPGSLLRQDNCNAMRKSATTRHHPQLGDI